MKKVLGLVSSPRKNGNSEIMTKEIFKHTGGSGQLEMLRLLDLDIEPCKACYSCMKPGKKCPRNDDMEFLFEKIDEADGIIISSPVYNWGINVGLKKVFDRAFLFPLWADAFDNKPCVTFVTYGVPYEEGYALATVNEVARQLHLRLKDTAEFYGSSPGEVLKLDKNMTMAKRLGKALFDPSYKRKAGDFECPNCYSNMIKFRSEKDLPLTGWRDIGDVECAFCGTVVELRATKGGIEAHYHGKSHYVEDIEARKARWHDAAIRDFMKEKDELQVLVDEYKNMEIKIVKKG